jgi:Zn-dependent peptidase ImmA (M78 family)
MPREDFKSLTKNLIIVALHEGVLGQMMHFPNPKGKFKIIQLTIPNGIPIDVLRFVVAHELGHATQGRNWKEGDGNKLEIDADKKALAWGFKRTKKIDEFIKKSWKKSDRC